MPTTGDSFWRIDDTADGVGTYDVPAPFKHAVVQKITVRSSNAGAQVTLSRGGGDEASPTRSTFHDETYDADEGFISDYTPPKSMSNLRVVVATAGANVEIEFA